MREHGRISIKKKKFNHKDLYPELNEENYPYYKRLYCARCGSRLGRYISHGTVRWICSSYKRKGQAKCPGVRIPDEIIKGWNLPDGKIYIMGKEDKNGEKHYSYTSESAYRVGGRTQQKTRNLRVAAYCRVSTDQEEQLNSFENQVEYYTKYIQDNPLYQMAGIYADEGISGTNTKKREEFKRMIRDCEEGKIDLVITKSISRFARNTQDCLEYSRRLKNLGIGIFFEKEHINTLDASGELLFTILSSLAQDESRNISENCKWGIRSKFKKGIPQVDCTKFLGYDKGDDGKLIVNKEQAKIVKRIYREFLNGYNPAAIAKMLMEDHIKTGTGREEWRSASVRAILKNEKYMGDALCKNLYSRFLTKKVKKNHGEVEQFYVKESHEAIIPKEQWEAAQLELERRDSYMQKLGLTFYGYGSEINPFSCRVVCGKCGAVCGKKSWKSRGVEFWQCNNRSKNHGVKGCASENLPHETCLRGLLRRGTRLLWKENNIFQNGRKRRRKEIR